MTTTQISATLGRKLIQNADKYFTNDDATILDEVIQNARRAGASEVVFTAHGDDLTISDNGKGLPSENAGVLLSLGDSDNGDAIETAENAAGLGFFSLANFSVEVRSRNWTMTVPKDAFTGSTTATLMTVNGYQAGLSLTIHGFLKGKSLDAMAKIIGSATRYSTMSARYVGFPVDDEIQMPANFLAEQLADKFAHHTIESNGVSVTVARGPRLDRTRTKINFFGKVITYDFVKSVPEVEKIASIKASGRVEEQSVYNSITIDVHDTSCLKLQLPQRQALIDNDGLKSVHALIEKAYVALLAKEGVSNGLPMDAALRKRYPAIPRPAVCVKAINGDAYISETGQLRNATNVVPVASAFAMTECSLSNTDGSLLHSLLNSINPPEFSGNRLFHADDLVKAFDANAFGYISTVSLILTHQDEEESVDLAQADASAEKAFYADLDMDGLTTAMVESGLDEYFNTVVDSLALRFKAVQPDGTEEYFAHPISGIFFCPDDYTWEPKIIIAKDRENDLTYMMMNGIDWYSDDVEAGSYNEQESEHDRQYDRLVASIIGKDAATFLNEVSDRIRNIIYSYDLEKILENGKLKLSIDIARSERSNFDLTVEKAAA
jgi:hypothetical protein